MIIAYIRHLESLANTRKKFCYEDEKQRELFCLPSDNDIPLTNYGIKHGGRIRDVLEQLELFDFNEIEVEISPYVRTVQTTEIIFPQFESRLKINPHLSERNSGWCSNMTQAEVDAHFPWLKRYWDETHPLLATPPGGESMLDVVHRVAPVIKEAQAQKKNKLYIGHGNLFKAFDFILQEMTFDQFLEIPNAPNGSLTLYRNVHLGKAGMTIDHYHTVLSD